MMMMLSIIKGGCHRLLKVQTNVDNNNIYVKINMLEVFEVVKHLV